MKIGDSDEKVAGAGVVAATECVRTDVCNSDRRRKIVTLYCHDARAEDKFFVVSVGLLGRLCWQHITVLLACSW